MKRIINSLIICALALPVFMAVGCSDGDDTPTVTSTVRLSSDKTAIIANGTDRVTFTVTSEGVDVSARAQIQVTGPNGQQSNIEGLSFTTGTAGNYSFTATYNSEISNTVGVSATAPAVPTTEKFFRRVCVMEATGVWCTNCPQASRALMLLQRNRPDRMVILAVHGEDLSHDPMTTPVTAMLDNIHKIPSYPAAVIDLRTLAEAANLSNGVIDAYDVSRKEYPATCGLRLESNYDASTGKIDITVGVTSNTGGAYRVVAMILEDGIVEPQIDMGYTTADYVHNDVVRKLLAGNLIGDALGTLTADVEVTTNYSTDVDAAWDIDNLRVVAYATDSSGYINNIVECEAKDGSCDYKYNED